MHHVLCLEEILLNIFAHLQPLDPSWSTERSRSTANLAALARTCRTFKDPALDILWSELIDLSPLAFCLPNSRCTTSSCYSFARPRNDAEWDTLKGYTRRVRHIVNFSSPNGCLNKGCISATFDSALPDPLFPNLRCLVWQGGTATLPAINFAAPLLTSLDIRGAPNEDVSLYIHLLDTLVPQCPNIRNIRVQVAGDMVFCNTVSRHLRRWQRLRVVDLLDVTLPFELVLFLTRIPTLMWLSFILDPHVPDAVSVPDTALVFSHLVYLEIVSESLEPVTNLLARVRLPSIQALIVPFSDQPSKAAVTAYVGAIARTCGRDALMDLRLLNLRSFSAPTWLAARRAPLPLVHDRLTLDDLAPCMTFTHLRGVHINLEWAIDLTDADVLALVSAWPHLEHLLLNDQWGWRTAGVTLNGLLQILRRCPRLQELCVAVDTRSAAAFSCEAAAGFVLPSPFWMNVADSAVELEWVPAVWTALSALGLSASHVLAWSGSEMKGIPGADTFRSRWMRLFR